MTDYNALKTKIDADHSGDTDEQIVESLNTQNLTGKRPILTAEIVAYLFGEGLELVILQGTSDPCKRAKEGLDRLPRIDITIPKFETTLTDLLDDLVTNVTEFTGTHKSEILALGSIPQSWAEQNFGQAITVKDVRIAKSI